MRRLLFAVLLCSMSGQISAQKWYYIPPAMKYNCDTTKWHWLYDYIMLNSGYTPFQYSGSENVVRAYMNSVPLNLKKGAPSLTADSLVRSARHEIKDYHYRSTTSTHGEFSILRYVKTRVVYNDSGASKLTETDMRYSCYAVKDNFLVVVLFWCEAPDSLIIDKEMNAVLDAIVITSPSDIDKDLHLPYKQKYVDSVLQAKTLDYDERVDLFFKKEYTETERKEWYVYMEQRSNGFYDGEGDSIWQSQAKFMEYAKAFFAKDKLIYLFEIKQEMQKDLESGFSYEEYYSIKGKAARGEYPVTAYLDYMYDPACDNELARLHAFGGDEPATETGLLIAFSRELFADSLSLSDFKIKDSPGNENGDGIYRFFIIAARTQGWMVVINIEREKGKWGKMSPSFIPAPEIDLNKSWELNRSGSSPEFILINKYESAYTLIGSNHIAANWLACDYSVKSENNYQFIYRNCKVNEDGNYSVVEENFNDLGNALTKLTKLQDSLYELAFSADTSEALFWQSSEYMDTREERLARADSVSKLIAEKKEDIRKSTKPDKLLFVSALHFYDIDGDGKQEAYYFAVSNGKLVDAKFYKLRQEIIGEATPANYDFIKTTKAFRQLALESTGK
jgi:hypothetical protein